MRLQGCRFGVVAWLALVPLAGPAQSTALDWGAAAFQSSWSGVWGDMVAAEATEAQGGGSLPVPMDEISDAERQRVLSSLDDARSGLEKAGLLARRLPQDGQLPAKALSTFAWPLRQAPVSGDFGYHGISNFVDQDRAYPNHVLDFFCGSRTYDLASGYNHQGTDIYTTPFPWKKMSENTVEVVAGAAGTILVKEDGNFDRSCSMNNNSWNAVYVQHADGSIAWYGHMKSGSLTPKPVGAKVEAGEFLGVVGSSGSSTGPHLHLELYDASNRLVDPWMGACNGMSKAVTWASQPSYYDPSINALVVGQSLPVSPSCPNVETPNDSGYVDAGGLGYFTVYARDQRPNDGITVKWYKPDGSLWRTSTSSQPSQYYTNSYWWWSMNLPQTPTGTWRLEVSMAGKTVSRTFAVGVAPPARRPVYRFYNTQTGAHFFTVSEAERDYVMATYKQFSYEGAAFYAYTQAASGTTPVYRFYNTQTNAHFYTINAAERDFVIMTYPAFLYEGAVWYARTASDSSTTALYRFYNTKTGTHFFTTSVAERDFVIRSYPSFTYENTGYYVWGAGN